MKLYNNAYFLFFGYAASRLKSECYQISNNIKIMLLHIHTNLLYRCCFWFPLFSYLYVLVLK